MAIKKYLFRADEEIFEEIEQIKSKLNISTTKDAMVLLIKSGVVAICAQHNITMTPKTEEIITIPEQPVSGFKLVDEAEIHEEVTIEEG